MHSVPWHIKLFGGLRAEQGEQVITRFRSQKFAALLAYLALFPQRAHAREELVDLLWPDAELEAGRANLRTALASLRRQLEPPGTQAGSVLVADGRTHVQLNRQAVRTDVAEFEAALAGAARARDAAESAHLRAQAVLAYGGPLLPGFYETWVLTERDRLAEAYLGALQQLSRHFEQAGDLDQALDYARRAVSGDPLREAAHMDVMRLLATAGQKEAALRQYRELERLLDEQLADEPSPEVRALAARIERQPRAQAPAPKLGPVGTETPAAVLAPPEPAGSVFAVQNEPESSLHLPLTFTRFFGREDEITALGEMLRAGDGRLVTVTGPGGGGKTRLAIETARRLRGFFPGGIWFAPMADLREPERIPDTIAAALGLPRQAAADPLEQVVQALRGKAPTLLVLDNLEHLLRASEPEGAGGAALVGTLREQVPTLTCLVTSRHRLLLDGEREFPLLPLPTPAFSGSPERLLEFPSVQLFLSRAQTVRPDFQISPRNAPAVAALCHKLEGIPLAIELAAAWAGSLTPAQMLDRLTRRFDLLVSHRRDLSPRHQTLRAAVAWSYELLPPEIQRFFARLSVFRGGCSLEAAEAVCGDGAGDALANGAFACLSELRDRSLLITEEQNEEMRYRLLETLREFAAEQLAESERAELAKRHADFFLGLAERIEPELSGPDQAQWLDQLEADRDNLRAALAWCFETKAAEPGLRLGSALWRYWWMRGHLIEGRRHLDLALEQGAAAPAPLRARALHAAGSLARLQGDYAAARPLVEESLRLRREAGDKRGMADSLSTLAILVDDHGQYDAAKPLYEESLALRREIGDTYGVAISLNDLGALASSQGDYPHARALLEESLALRRARNDTRGVMYVLNNLGMVAYALGDYREARALLEEAVSRFRALGHDHSAACALSNLAMAACRDGDFDAARSCVTESLLLLQRLGDRLYITTALEAGALLAAQQGPHPEGARRAARLWGAAASLRETLGFPMSAAERAEHERDLADVRRALGEAGVARAWEAGCRMGYEEAIACALEE